MEIARSWGKDKIKEGERVIYYMRGGPSTEKCYWYIAFFYIFYIVMRQVYPKIL